MPQLELIEVVPASDYEALREELEEANAALFECARLSGADTSDGVPTWPKLPLYARGCVANLREDYDKACDEACDEEARVAKLEAALEELATWHHRILRPSKLHNPAEQPEFRSCTARTCEKAAAALTDGGGDE